ncbi:MAG: hypothetical protein VCA40_10265, partial [Roseibacillus sp.]
GGARKVAARTSATRTGREGKFMTRRREVWALVLDGLGPRGEVFWGWDDSGTGGFEQAFMGKPQREEEGIQEKFGRADIGATV